ncbi:hypothetical protein CEXT_14051, partial [Caerostris extrusa]
SGIALIPKTTHNDYDAEEMVLSLKNDASAS